MRALDALMAEALPGAPDLTFLDEPALVLWKRDNAPIEREEAVDLLSGCLAASRSVTGVHVCGDGDLRLAFEAGTEVLGVPVSEALIDDADVLARHIDADGWIAWGAIPTDRPIGDSGDALWRKLAGVWCELTRRGCDPVQPPHPRHHHAGVRSRRPRHHAGRARAAARDGPRRAHGRPGRRRPPHRRRVIPESLRRSRTTLPSRSGLPHCGSFRRSHFVPAPCLHSASVTVSRPSAPARGRSTATSSGALRA